MIIILSILILTATYLIGSIPTGLIVGKVFYKKNLHTEGSGATGATNSVRVLGKRAGLFVFLFDITKALIPALLVSYFHFPINPTIIAFVAILGHCFPIFANFKGGKAVATSFGFFVVFFPWPTLFGFLVFTFAFILFNMISLSSILTATVILLFVLLDQPFVFTTSKLFVFFIWALLIYRHSSNISRIIHKKENKMNVSSKGKFLLTAVTAIVILSTSLFTLLTPKDNAALKTLFEQEISHLETQTKNYEEVAQTNPTPRSYYNIYKSKVLHDAYTLMTYDINSAYTPVSQNDISEKLVVEYSFSSRINLNAHEADEVFNRYSLQYQLTQDAEKKKSLLVEMKNYLFQNLPATRTQGPPNERISLQYTKVNDKWLLPSNQQVALTNYLNSHIFVNNFSTSYLSSDDNALSKTIQERFKKQQLPTITNKESLPEFTEHYITYLKNDAFNELVFTINNSSTSFSNNTDTLNVSYSFNTKTFIPSTLLRQSALQKQQHINTLPQDKKEQALMNAKQELIDTFKKRQDTIPTPIQFALNYTKAGNPAQWTMNEDDFKQFETFVNSNLITEIDSKS